MIEAALGERLEGILPVGRSPRGTTRLAWTEEDALARRWFTDEATRCGLTAERDPAGSLWAVPDAAPPWWALGSHLDSVLDGGPFDGALGVAAGFEVAARASVPVAVISFADEEGARFNTPTFGSRALTGALDVAVLERRDRDGVRLADAMRRADVDPHSVARAPEWLGRLRGFLELHIDQTTDLAHAGRPAGVVRGLVSRLRVRARVEGRADHAGTTPPEQRSDALAAAARLIVAALGAADGELVATASRIEVEPNALTTVPALATVWLDARAPDRERVRSWRVELERAAGDIAAAGRVGIEFAVESETAGTEFDAGLRQRLVALSEQLGEPAPEVDCYAGHDAGLMAARVPAAMVLVRNESGVSHSPDERVRLDDAAFGTELLLRLVEELAR